MCHHCLAQKVTVAINQIIIDAPWFHCSGSSVRWVKKNPSDAWWAGLGGALRFSLGKRLASSNWPLDFRLALPSCLPCAPPGCRGLCPYLKTAAIFGKCAHASPCIGVVGKTPDKAHNRTAAGTAEGFLSAAGQTAWLVPAAFALGPSLPLFVLEEEAGKGLALFTVGEQQLLAWVGPGWGF